MPDSSRNRSGDTRHTDSKVGRVIHEYGLDGMGEDLEALWTGQGEERYSLRKLADYLNRAILQAAMADAGMETLEGEVENTYRLLTDDEVSRGMRTQTRKRLENAGVDVDAVERDFVSHQAIHTYLTDFREAEHAASVDSEEDRITKDIETIQRLQSRTQAVTENTLDRLVNSGELDVGSVDVLVDVRVLCEDCGTTYDVRELLERGRCGCES